MSPTNLSLFFYQKMDFAGSSETAVSFSQTTQYEVKTTVSYFRFDFQYDYAKETKQFSLCNKNSCIFYWCYQTHLKECI
jgi:hypothetical protein